MVKYCRTCALANLKLLKCRRFGHSINPNEDFCSRHYGAIPTCAICGQEMLKETSFIDFKNGEHLRIICQKCNEMLHTCALCKNGQDCAFNNDPSPIPKQIQKQYRNGPMISVVQEINPERVAITCAKGCSCYNPENGCLRQYNTCERCENV